MFRLLRLSITGGLFYGGATDHPSRGWTVYLCWPIKIDFWSSATHKGGEQMTMAQAEESARRLT